MREDGDSSPFVRARILDATSATVDTVSVIERRSRDSNKSASPVHKKVFRLQQYLHMFKIEDRHDVLQLEVWFVLQRKKKVTTS